MNLYFGVQIQNMKGYYPLVFLLSVLFISCNNNEDDSVPGTSNNSKRDTWEVIQTEIWDVNCISCHSAGNTFATQSNLVLTSDVAYEQLIDRDPKNAAAKADGLKLLGNDGLASMQKSFLWEKINAQDREHFYSDHPEYGSQMPLGPTPLTNGELEYIAEWILKGAPKTGIVADEVLLEDTSRYQTPLFFQLDSPDRGFQFHIDEFQVPANTDYEFFYYLPAISSEDIFIKQVEISMRTGSHHFLAYTFDNQISASLLPPANTIREVYLSNGNYNITTLIPTQYHEFVTGTQWPFMNYSYPEGIALRLPAGKGLDLNSHYANKSASPITGEVYMNIHTVEQNEVQHPAEILQLNNQSFILPANKVTTIEKTYYFNEKRHIFQLFSHAHEHMTEFQVLVKGGDNDGELVYVSYDWEHPPILELDPPLVLEADQGLTLKVTYDNDEDVDLSFGLRSSDEMMILFGAYY